MTGQIISASRLAGYHAPGLGAAKRFWISGIDDSNGSVLPSRTQSGVGRHWLAIAVLGATVGVVLVAILPAPSRNLPNIGGLSQSIGIMIVFRCRP